MNVFAFFLLLAQLDVNAWEQHVVRLASDETEGRAPGTPGGEAAARYIAEQLDAAGLTPAGDRGYLQPVPLADGNSSANVVGTLEGAERASGNVVLTAHYDAYGIGEADETGDTVYNGALDNACGVAALIELARYFAERDAPLKRTLVFVATTAEETGSLGLEFYAEHPAVPLDQTIVNINVDGINTVGPTEDFIVFPSEGTETRAALELIGKRAGMSLGTEPWQDGMHFAFDTRVFLERSIVGLTLWQGSRYRGLSSEEVSTRRGRFGQIHSPGDEWPGWFDAAAVEQHLRLYITAIEHYAGDAPGPRLSDSNPFQR